MLFFVFTLGLLSCATVRASALDDQFHRAMPASEYALITSSVYKSFVRNSPIDGYVKMLGAVSGDNVIIREVLESQPGSVDIKTAKSLASRAKLNGQTGSRISPPVDVFRSILYNQEKADKVALVFASFGASASHADQSYKNCYIEIVKYQVDPKNKPAAKAEPAAASKSAPAPH